MNLFLLEIWDLKRPLTRGLKSKSNIRIFFCSCIAQQMALVVLGILRAWPWVHLPTLLLGVGPVEDFLIQFEGVKRRPGVHNPIVSGPLQRISEVTQHFTTVPVWLALPAMLLPFCPMVYLAETTKLDFGTFPSINERLLWSECLFK
jgi:hypothetical protein